MKSVYFSELEALCREINSKVKDDELSKKLSQVLDRINLFKIADQFTAQDFIKYSLLAEVDDDKVNALVYSIVSLPRLCILAEVVYYLAPHLSPSEIYAWLDEPRRKLAFKSAIDVLKDYMMDNEFVRETLMGMVAKEFCS